MIDGIQSSGLVISHLTRLNVKKKLVAWIRHLAWQITTGGSGRTTLVYLDKYAVMQKVTFDPVDDPVTELESLVKICREGSRRLLPFFPDISDTYWDQFAKDADHPENAMKAAVNAWEKATGDESVVDNWEYRLLYRDTNPLDGEFAQLARRVFDPLYNHIQETGKSK